MKGKIGLVVGLGAGYVLGTRAGRERYEQIKTQWLKVWNLDPVQEQVDKVKGYVGDKAAAVPGAIWNGLQKVAGSVGGKDKTAGQRLDSAVAAGKKAADDIVDVAEDAVDEAKDAAKKPAAKKPASSRPTAAKSGS
ncbi:hypothetical protein [Microbacterium foliorum]|uniref:hypothetical protein n=1 Tax=Microbacterium foliorum TaxID=104336 RepID=UPI001D30DE29|nr:hypothetical protein [Microbacterium foliorum]CAH0200134.1 hypothetical protein SRABI03_01965 [Microbacterium foliorum]CAH0201564.1 hypothetical protein SRABI44_01938 [Microbacterium foliorum]